MEHVVFFTEGPGAPEFRRVADLEEAVRFVESLRNERGIADVSVHALTPVPVSFRTYYRVEIGPAEPEPSRSPRAEAPSEPVVEAHEEPGLEVPSLADPELEAVSLKAESLEDVSSEAVSAVDVSFEVPSLADDTPAGPSLALLPPPPLESAPVFDLDEPGDEPVAADEPQVEPAVATEDEFESLASYEPLVPQVRSEPEGDRSLGYFAR